MQKPGRRSLLSVVQREIQKKRFKSFVSQNQRSGTLKSDMNTKRFIKRYRECPEEVYQLSSDNC